MTRNNLLEWIGGAVIIATVVGLVRPHLDRWTVGDAQTECRQSMQLLATAQELAFARGGGYAPGAESPAKQVSPRVCPSTGFGPAVRVSAQTYVIECPDGGRHGAIHGGLISWATD